MKKHPLLIREIISIFFSLVFLTGIFIFIYLTMPVSNEKKWKEIEIPKGSSYSRGIDILKEEGIIEHKLPLLLLGRLMQVDRSMRAGYYNLNTSMSLLEVFNRLKKGMIVVYSITIPEGSTLDDIKAKLEAIGLINEASWKIVNDFKFLNSLAINAPSLEGYIYPDTYSFAKGADPESIFTMMVQRMREQFNDKLHTRARELGMSENEVLTLASIIEKEAIYNSEKPIISAVYHNRLRLNMKLQADPTVMYGVKDRWKRIRYRDLRRLTPYNTYVIRGLPPGPIASPGIRSINAALYPDNSDYLFFVAMNNGRHYFSVTGEEHVRAVELYQRTDYNKTANEEQETD